MTQNRLPDIVKRLMEHVPALQPNRIWDEDLDGLIRSLSADDLLGTDMTPANRSNALALQSGLLLWNENLDASHTLSQDIDNPTGSYWHGIMHRMEGDFSNAKYWFRLTGSHPVYGRLYLWTVSFLKDKDTDPTRPDPARSIAKLAEESGWNPYLFVDLVEAASRLPEDSETVRTLAAIQKQEILLLTEYGLSECGRTLDDGAVS